MIMGKPAAIKISLFSFFMLLTVFTRGADMKPFSSIVKVFVVKSSPDYHQPWRNHPQVSGTGSGCLISDQRILTNAHNVNNATFIMVQKQGDTKKYVARIESVGHECDLAILKVKDESFYENMPALKLGELPNLQDTVTVLGYPTGGNNISITEGVVSRIEPQRYSHSGRCLLTIQIDAAINPGNSGGPVIQDGKIVGIAFQGRQRSENMGFMVPTPIIKHFLVDIKDGTFDGFPDVDVDINNMENPDFRKWAKMNKDQSGVIISHVPMLEKKKGFFKEDDIIMAVDGVSVANDATIPFRQGEVIFFGNLIWLKYIGDICKFELLRDGKVKNIDYKLSREKRLVPFRKFDTLPSYYIFGGLIFVPLTQNYLDAWGRSWVKNAPDNLLNLLWNGEITEQRDQVVVLSKVLADDINIGYHNIRYRIVDSVNGAKVKNLKDFIKKINGAESRFVEISFENHDKIVLNKNEAIRVTPEILKRYRIDSDCSVDLK